MLGMDTANEVDSPPTGHTPPPPTPGGEIALPLAPADRPPPTPAAVLRWIAAAKGEPWFPSRHAAQTGTDRDSLDEPLNVLRLAGLVRVETWVRGLGQGYVPTPEGLDAAAAGLSLTNPAGAAVELSPAPPPAEPAAPGVLDADRRTTSRLGLDPRPPLVVPLLLIANVACFFVGLVGAIRGGYPVGKYLVEGHTYILHRLGAVNGEDLLNGEWWRLFVVLRPSAGFTCW